MWQIRHKNVAVVPLDRGTAVADCGTAVADCGSAVADRGATVAVRSHSAYNNFKDTNIPAKVFSKYASDQLGS